MHLISTDRAPAPGGHHAQAMVHGDLVFCCGQVGIDPATGQLAEGVAGQTEQCLRNLAAVLEAAGSGLEPLVKTTVFLDEISDFAEFNETYARVIAVLPARSTVGAKLAGELLVEIEAIGVIGRP